VQKMIFLSLNCYRTKNITEEKEKKELGPTLALKKTYIGLVLMKELSGEDVLVFEKLK